MTDPDGDKSSGILLPGGCWKIPAFDIGLGLGTSGIFEFEVAGYPLSLYAKFTDGHLDFTWYAP